MQSAQHGVNTTDGALRRQYAVGVSLRRPTHRLMPGIFTPADSGQGACRDSGLIPSTHVAEPLIRAGNSGQGATASLASTATTAMWNVQLAESKGGSRVRIPLSPPIVSRYPSPSYISPWYREFSGSQKRS
jgi:hypothetical protein